MEKHRLHYVEFYITNVCNLNCPNCNRFNNFYFKGHYNWKDNEHVYRQWSEIIDFNNIGILGGESLLNPDFDNWFLGICDLWPNSSINITTNGTMLTKKKKLYNLLTSVKNKVMLSVGCHNLDLKDLYQQQCENLFLDDYSVTYGTHDIDYKAWKNSYNIIKDVSWPECNTPEDFLKLPQNIQHECQYTHGVSYENHRLQYQKVYIKNGKNFTISLYPQHRFVNSTVIYDNPTQTLSLNKSDPKKAMDICMLKTCHHFIEGKLYKCGPVGVLPEFIKQYHVERDAEQDELIHSYRPASVDWNQNDLKEFIKNLHDEVPIPQCSLCPDKFVETEFAASSNKIKIRQID